MRFFTHLVPLRVTREDAGTIRFTGSNRSGWMLAAAGVVMAKVVPGLVGNSPLAELAYPAGLITVAVGAAALLYHHRLELDFARGRWKRALGFLPAPAQTAGSLDELERLTLKRVTSASGMGGNGGNHTVWVVHLEASSWDAPVQVGWENREGRARALMGRLARRLHLPAVDRTGPVEVVHDPAPRPVADRPARRSARRHAARP